MAAGYGEASRGSTVLGRDWRSKHIKDTTAATAIRVTCGRINIINNTRTGCPLPYLGRRATESRSRDTAQWIAAYVRPERRYHTPGGTGLRHRQLRCARKPLASRYCQPLSGHTAIGSFFHEHMTGPQRLESNERWWCNCGERQTRHHLFTGCRVWAPQIRRLLGGVGNDPRAPSVS